MLVIDSFESLQIPQHKHTHTHHTQRHVHTQQTDTHTNSHTIPNPHPNIHMHTRETLGHHIEETSVVLFRTVFREVWF